MDTSAVGEWTTATVTAQIEVDELASAVGGDVTALLDERCELATAALDPRLHARQRNALHSRRIGLGVTLEVGEFERPPIVGRQRIDQWSNAGGEFRQSRLLVVEPSVGARVGDRFDLGGEHLAAAPGAAVVVGDRVAGDSEHPCRDPLPVVERPEVLVDAQHYLGDDIVRLMWIADAATHETL